MSASTPATATAAVSRPALGIEAHQHEAEGEDLQDEQPAEHRRDAVGAKTRPHRAQGAGHGKPGHADEGQEVAALVERSAATLDLEELRPVQAGEQHDD